MTNLNNLVYRINILEKENKELRAEIAMLKERLEKLEVRFR